MTEPLSLFAALVIGLSGGLHCVAMCGGIASALGYASQQKLSFLLAYNGGRILSYAILGLLFASATAVFNAHSIWAHRVLQGLSSLLLIGIGLHIGFGINKIQWLESSGAKVWQAIQPLALKLFPVNTHLKAWALGMCWGWLPCGLVYSTLALSASSASPLVSATMMAIFGAGTLPWLLASLFAGQRLRGLHSMPTIKRVMGIVLIALGIVGLFEQFAMEFSKNTTPNEHHHHH